MRAKKVISGIVCGAALTVGLSSGVMASDNEIVIALVMKSLASEWNQNIQTALENWVKKKDFL